MRGRRIMCKDGATNISLSEVYRRLEFLERRALSAGSGDCDCEDGAPGADGADGAPGADGADGAPGADGADGADGAPAPNTLGMFMGITTTNTAAARRWFNIPGGGPITAGVGSAYLVAVPTGFTQIVGMALVVVGAGSGAVNFTYVATVGDLTSETDTSISITTASTFTGVSNVSGSAAVTAGQVIRVAHTKSGAAATAASGIGVCVVLAA